MLYERYCLPDSLKVGGPSPMSRGFQFALAAAGSSHRKYSLCHPFAYCKYSSSILYHTWYIELSGAFISMSAILAVNYCRCCCLKNKALCKL